MKKIFILLGVVMMAGVVFAFWQTTTQDKPVLANPPAIPAFLIGGLAPEQQHAVDDFKRLIFARIALPEPLTDEEKVILSSIVETQSISYQFSEVEEKKIQEALR